MSKETQMLKRVGIGIGIGLAVLAALGAAEPVVKDAEVDAVRVAVFREQVPFWLDEHSRESKTVVCLSIDDGSARRSVSGEYLKHFPGEAAVRTGDACEELASGAVERGTGRPAVLVAVGAIAWKSADEAWVTTRHFRTAVISGLRTQRVVRERSGWVCLGQIIHDAPL
jgi:hypothetical protein